MTDGNKIDEGSLSEFVTEATKGSGAPGAVVGILHNGETVIASYGVTSVENPLPVTDETLFQIGSITKTFTATAIMRLVEMGKLDLETTVRTYVPDFQVQDEKAASQATIRHLLTHTGGWEGDFYDDTGAGDDALENYVVNMAELEQLAPTGEVYSYCNSGFCLAGLVIERVTNKSYQVVLKELILEPLAMTSSYLEPGDVMTHRYAVGHHVTEEGAKVACPWPVPRFSWPAGGITCHVKDLLHFARFHLTDGSMDAETRLLSTESMAQMKSPQVTIWKDEAVGLSWHMRNEEGAYAAWHSGGTNGQVSFLSLTPKHHFAIAILTNADRGGAIIKETRRWALRECLGKEIQEPKPIESSEEELAQYVGRYRRPSCDIELGMAGGRLIGQVTPKKGSTPTKDSPPGPAWPPFPFILCEKDRFMLPAARFGGIPTGDIVRKSDGSIGWLRAGGRIHVREA